MSLNYDPTAYETWRQNYEMREALAWFGGCIWYFMWGNFMGANGATLGFVLCCAVMAIISFRPAVRRYHMTLRLAGTPLPYIDFEELKRILNDPTHKGDMWLGRGFPWGQRRRRNV